MKKKPSAKKKLKTKTSKVRGKKAVSKKTAVLKKVKTVARRKLKKQEGPVKVVEPEIVGFEPQSSKNLPSIRKSHAEKAQEPGLVSSDPLAQYLAEIRKYPLLTPEEEKQLAVRYFEKKDPLAAEKLVTSNLRFVVKIAMEYAKMGAKLMDVIQEGNVGLMHAVKEYNPYKGVKLITYAVWWIRGYMREYLMKQFSMVKIGTTQSQKKLYYNLEKEERELKALGFEPKDVQLLSSRLGVSEKDVMMMQQRMSSKDVSLDAPLDEDGSGSHFIDMQTDNTNPEDQLEILELIDLLKDKVEEIKPGLNEKELDILENRILADEPQTLQEIGNRYGISRERARQLEERLLKNIKEHFLEMAHKTVEKKINSNNS